MLGLTVIWFMKNSASSIFKPAAAAQRIRNLIFGEVCAEPVGNLKINKEERYSRVPRLSGRKNAVVEYLDYQIAVTQLMGPKGNGDIK